MRRGRIYKREVTYNTVEIGKQCAKGNLDVGKMIKEQINKRQ